MLEEKNGILELQRNELATRMGCVPSQINYVIASRFNQERGYLVESRRGGGGYIKITRIQIDKSKYLMHLLGAIGDSIDALSAKGLFKAMCENQIITPREFKILSNALSDNVMSKVAEKDKKDKLRADMFKSVILSLV